MPDCGFLLAIKQRREELGVTQEVLAELAEVGLRTLKGIESGTANPTMETVLKLLDVLGLTLSIEVKHPEINE